MECLICQNSNLENLGKNNHRDFFKCSLCDFIFLDPKYRLNSESEKKRYLLHQNHIADLEYQKFVQPLVDVVKSQNPGPQAQGLDFGCGSAPVLAELLKQQGYPNIHVYDPYFFPELKLQADTYDFIVACEVVEHLYFPLAEFTQLFNYLKPKGFLVIKSHFWSGQNIQEWYYASDPTHVSIYNIKSLNQISTSIGFSSLQILNDRVAILFK